MGLMGIILALAGSHAYRQLILSDQQQAFSRLMALKADDLLQQLYRQVTALGAVLQMDSAFQAAVKQRDIVTLQQHLDAQFKQVFVTAHLIHAQKMLVFDDHFQLITQSSNLPATLSICPAYIQRLAQRQGAERLKPAFTLCQWHQKPTFAVIIPIGSVRLLGYLLIATDPVSDLKKMESVLGMPLRIQDAAAQSLYTTVSSQPALQSLASTHTLKDMNGQPVLTLIAWNEITRLNQQLQYTRYWILLVALSITLVVIVLVLIRLNRQLLLPLHRLMKHLRQIEVDEQDYLGEPLTLQGCTEIQTLTAGFNQMTAALKQTYEALQQQHDHLDDLVQERTRELLLLRDQALQANQAKSRFIANISHEFRTPLNALLGYSEILYEEAQDRGHSYYLEDLKRLREASQRLLVLVNDALAVANIETGHVELNLARIPLPPLLADLNTAMQARLQKQGNQFYITSNKNTQLLYTDAEKLKQILLNLLDNANKFTQSGIITLKIDTRTLNQTDWVEFQVIDNGIGIEPAQIGHLFELFTQGDDSASRHYEGTGLGLALSQRFSHLLGGRITVESTLGKGSVFTLVIPVEVLPDCCFTYPSLLAPPIGEPSNPAQLRFNLKKCPEPYLERRRQLTTLLLLTVDTDNMTAPYLTHLGFRVQVCHDPVEGLVAAKALQPDVIILKSVTATAHSWALFQGLKRDPILARVPLIVLSALPQQQEAVFARGISGCVTKPIGHEHLNLMVQQFILAHSRSILVVESDPILWQMIQRILEKHDWHLIQATDAQQALTLLAQHQPGLILLDLYLPPTDGFQLVTTLRQQVQWRKLPIIVMSANDLSQSECMQLNGWNLTEVDQRQEPTPEQLQALHDMILSCIRGRAQTGEK